MSRSLLQGWVRVQGQRCGLREIVLALYLLGGCSAFAQPAAATPTQTEQPLVQTVPAPRINRPVLQLGSQGTDVSELQAALKLLGYYTGVVDGIYSQATADAVVRFQKAAGLNPDGTVGPGTWEQLFPSIATAVPDFPCLCSDGSTGIVSTASGDFPTLQIGLRGTAVVGLQQRLKAQGLYLGPIDGIFGADTQAAVVLAQQGYGLTPNGIVDFSTWQALLR
jgi:N-acetylmuramoyl-L-alanine amidase